MTRQLAAIMFTDIVGYTALMQQDEQLAKELRDRHRLVLQKEIPEHRGKILQYYGDGTLSVFDSALDAVQCSIAIQKQLQVAPSIPIRIGIHTGDIVYEENDIYGDGVNVSSRIQSLSVPGGVLISEKVYDDIKNHPEIITIPMGSFELKNVKKPVEVFALANEGLKVPSEQEPLAGNFSSEVSIAVLPFVNMSNDPEQEYFSDGMAEEIINSLAHLEKLKVAGRTSSFQFKGKNIDLRQVGEQLGVKTVLEGSIRKQGNRLRVTAQLVNVHDGFHLWSERYDRDMDDIFAIQDQIALAITEKLKITLLEKDREIFHKAPTQNTEAYELYLKGRFYLSRRGRFILAGMQYFEQAIGIDPNFALAHAGYADACGVAAVYGFVRGKDVKSRMKQSAEKAIALNSTLCEAYCSLGTYYEYYERNWEEAKKNFLRSIELNPGYAQAHSWYGMLYKAFGEGNFEEAEREGQIGIKLEPLSAIDHADLAWSRVAGSKFEDALAEARTGIELDANSFLSHWLAGIALLGLGRYEESISSLKHLIKISDRHQHSINALIWALCANGKFDEARTLMNELLERSKTEYISQAFLAVSHAYLGNLNFALDHLEQANEDLDPLLIVNYRMPFVPQSLRNNKQYQNLMGIIGFPK
ncbi:MAG TPA: adenylate/guanylate cyclase domain-containing protein [Chitinophagales bacterium]|nr:adenylate/guanylate cyclase domain-containing protein [Chitinophagales bacterium]